MVSWKSCDASTIKLGVTARPAALVSSIGPVTALFGTITRTSVALADVTMAGIRALLPPAKVTTGLLLSTLSETPMSVTPAPTGPLLVLRASILGGDTGRTLIETFFEALAFWMSVAVI